MMATAVNVSDDKQAFIGLLGGKKGVIMGASSDASNVSSSLNDVEMGKRRRQALFRKSAPWLMILLAAGALATLVAFEMIRSNEMQRMRSDIDVLRKDVDVLKQRIQDEDLIDDLKAFEEEVNAEKGGHRITYQGAHHMGLDDIDDLDDDDDEDDDDDDIGASGDDDYDISYDNGELQPTIRDANLHHRPDIVTALTDKTSHDELPPAPTDDARGFHDAPEELLDVGEYRRRRAEEANREKREISGATRQGVPILEESYADRRNRTDGDDRAFRLHESLVKHARHEGPMLRGRGWEKDDEFRHQPAVYARRRVPSNMDYATLERDAPVTGAPKPITSSGVHIRRSRVMNTDEDKSKAYRRLVKKTSLSTNTKHDDRYQEQVSPVEARMPMHRRRTHRAMRKNLEAMGNNSGAVQGRHRPLPAAHFNGDTSKYEQGKHEHYNGNGRLRHPDGVFTDWQPAPWVGALGMDRHFRLADGSVTIKDTGLYFVYAQVHYLDEHDTNGYRVYRNDEPLLQCTTMTHSTDRVAKSNTCYTAAASHLLAGDRLSLRDLGGMRYALFEPTKSFFGIVKLGDARIK